MSRYTRRGSRVRLLCPVDQLDLMEFASDVREVVPFTNNLHQIDNGLERLRGGPATALYDTIFLASESLAGRPGRKVLVLITDGDDTVNGIDYPRALEQALRSEVLVYSIIDVPIPADAGRDTGGEHALITLSQETGGKHYYAESSDLESAFQKVSEDLRTQYLLGYYPSRHSDSADFRTISVGLRGYRRAPIIRCGIGRDIIQHRREPPRTKLNRFRGQRESDGISIWVRLSGASEASIY